MRLYFCEEEIKNKGFFFLRFVRIVKAREHGYPGKTKGCTNILTFFKDNYY